MIVRQGRTFRTYRTAPRKMAFIGAIVLVVVLSTWCCGRPPTTATRLQNANSNPNVVFIVVDTLRADHLSLYGYSRPTSPNLDRLASRALVYERAYTVMSHTLPAHVSLFTGIHPATHKVLSNGWRYDGTYPTLAERLKERGYDTAAFVSGFPLTADTGLNKGFDVYEEATSQGRRTFKIPGQRTNERTVSWLKSRGDRPFFLFVHYFDTHVPYMSNPDVDRPFAVDDVLDARLRELGAEGLSITDVSPVPVTLADAPLSLRAAVNEYDNQIYQTDTLIGNLLEALEQFGFADHSLLVITSDHGQGLGQHQYFSHGLHLYEEQLQIPLIVRPPADMRWTPGRIRSTVSLLDVVPTVMKSVGLDVDEGLHGRRLPMGPAEEALASRWIVAQRRHFSEEMRQKRGAKFAVDSSLHALRGDSPLKYLRTGRGVEELYDLSDDPGELHNLADARPDDCARMGALLSQILADRSAAGAIIEPRLDPETRKQLEALGYVQ